MAGFSGSASRSDDSVERPVDLSGFGQLTGQLADWPDRPARGSDQSAERPDRPGGREGGGGGDGDFQKVKGAGLGVHRPGKIPGTCEWPLPESEPPKRFEAAVEGLLDRIQDAALCDRQQAEKLAVLWAKCYVQQYELGNGYDRVVADNVPLTLWYDVLEQVAKQR